MVQGGALVLILSVLLGLTLLGNPAPTTTGPVELLLLAGVMIATLLGLARGRLVYSARIGPSHASIVVALALYCLSLLGTLALGILQGAPAAPALRAVGPYLLFLPVAAVGPWLSEQSMPYATVRALVVVGLGHAIYLLALFVTGVQDILDLRSVFFGRTTLLDARTTVPLFLASGILPLAWLAGDGRPARKALALIAIILSMAGALSTQTRSQLLALAAGGLAFLPFYCVQWARRSGRPLRVGVGRGIWAITLAVLLTSTAVTTVPTLGVLVRSVALRGRADQDNGRVANEWVPAAKRVSETPTALALGIGAGQTFMTGGGEERTYVHNLAIYTLLYSGLIGVVATAILYLTIGVLLARRAWRERGLENAALLALLVALAVYAEFFAVHKLLSYNLMIALIAAAAVPPAARAQATQVSV